MYGPLRPCQVSEKTNESIPRKLTDNRKDGWKDEQTLFYRTLPAEAGGPIKFFNHQQYFKTFQTRGHTSWIIHLFALLESYKQGHTGILTYFTSYKITKYYIVKIYFRSTNNNSTEINQRSCLNPKHFGQIFSLGIFSYLGDIIGRMQSHIPNIIFCWCLRDMWLK